GAVKDHPALFAGRSVEIVAGKVQIPAGDCTIGPRQAAKKAAAGRIARPTKALTLLFRSARVGLGCGVGLLLTDRTFLRCAIPGLLGIGFAHELSCLRFAVKLAVFVIDFRARIDPYLATTLCSGYLGVSW